MADRFDEMAAKLEKGFDCDWFGSKARAIASIATALRELAAAEGEASAADMRERAAMMAGVQSVAANCLPKNTSANELAAWLIKRDFKLRDDIRSLPLTTPKET